jgi:hypothetical protein
MKLIEKSPYEIGYSSGKGNNRVSFRRCTGQLTAVSPTDHGVVFPAFEVAERRSLNFKPNDDISIDFRYMGYNAYESLAIL